MWADDELAMSLSRGGVVLSSHVRSDFLDDRTQFVQSFEYSIHSYLCFPLGGVPLLE